MGALRDVVQNHLLQVIALLAMDAPAGRHQDALRSEKVQLFNALRPIDPADYPDAASLAVRWREEHVLAQQPAERHVGRRRPAEHGQRQQRLDGADAALELADEAAHLDLILHLAEGNGYPAFDGRYVGRAVGLSTDRHLIDLSRPWPRFDAADQPSSLSTRAASSIASPGSGRCSIRSIIVTSPA